MANNKIKQTFKRRSFRCSDAEWEKITQSAKMMNLSASRFLVKKAYSEGGDDAPDPIAKSDVTRILNCSRLVAFDLMDKLRASHSLEDFNLILARTNNEYVTLDELKKK